MLVNGYEIDAFSNLTGAYLDGANLEGAYLYLSLIHI